MTRWVVDASPLVFLAKIDRLHLLREGADEILVPGRVLEEIQRCDDPAAALVEGACEGWLQRVPWSRDEPEPRLGELTAIELAVDCEAERIVLDDLAARRLARSRGVAVIGTLGLLLAARLRNDLTDLRAEIRGLESHGYRASRELIARVLAQADE